MRRGLVQPWLLKTCGDACRQALSTIVGQLLFHFSDSARGSGPPAGPPGSIPACRLDTP